MKLTDEKNITLTLTEQCNLQCVYCYEKNRTGECMTFDIAKEIIDREMNMDDETKRVNFSLFGGEPFMNFSLLKQIIEYLYSNEWEKTFTCSTCTNGTLVHGEIKSWLLENKEKINVGLSFDGTKEMQDVNRCCSFDNIDLDFFAKNWMRNTVKMTISQKSLETMAEGVIFLHKKGFDVSCNLAYGLDWTDKRLCVLLEGELSKLIDFYLENPSIKPCRMLSAGIKFINGKTKKTVKKWCGTGVYMRTYDVKGNSYPCQFFMPLSMGEEKSISAKAEDIIEDIPTEYFGDKCSSCPLISYCPTCLGSNYYETGNLYKKAPGYCELQKIILLANSYFQYQQLERGQLELSPKDRYCLLRGIKVVQEYIAKDNAEQM